MSNDPEFDARAKAAWQRTADMWDKETLSLSTEKQTWLWADTDFVEVDYVSYESYSFSTTEEDLSWLYIRNVEVGYGDIYSPSASDDVKLSKSHDGTAEGVIKAVQEEFGVTLKARPDLGVVVFEIVDGV